MKFKSDIEVQAGLKDSSGAIGTSGQLLSSTGTGVSWTSLTGFVTLDTTQTITGIKTFTQNVTAKSVTLGAATGDNQILLNLPADNNLIYRENAGSLYGFNIISDGTDNSLFLTNTEGSSNQTLYFGDGIGDKNIFGISTKDFTDPWSAKFVINANGKVGLSNNNPTEILDVIGNGLFSGSLTANSFIKLGGTSSQYLMADGSVSTGPTGFVPYTGANQNVNLGIYTLLAAKGVFSSSGSANTVEIGHSSGSGIALNIIKGGNGEGLYINKTSGTGNAATIIGTLNATTLVKSGGTAAQILAADGTVITAGTGISISGGTISSTVVGGVTSFNTRTGAVTLSSTDVNTALGYTAADDSQVVKLTGNQTIGGEKTFSTSTYLDGNAYLLHQSAWVNYTNYTTLGGLSKGIFISTTSAAAEINMNNLTALRSYELPNANGTLALTSDIHSPVTIGTPANGLSISGQVLSLGLSGASTTGALSSTDWSTFNSKQNQLNGTGFVRMSGTTPSYITGSSDQYVKADGSLSTALNSRVEVNFTATAGQTTFTTTYDVGQIDVFYNGSKLNPSEFTATNGTTVVLAQAATLNAQISIVKYIGSINGVSGTANRVAKFTGITTLGDSQIDDNGTNVSIGYTTNPNTHKLDVNGNSRITGISLFDRGTLQMTLNPSYAGGNVYSQLQSTAALAFATGGDNNRLYITSSGDVGIGTPTPTTRLTVQGGYANFTDGAVNIYAGSDGTGGLFGTITNHYQRFITNNVERMRIFSSGNVGINTGDNDAGFRVDVNGTGRFSGALTGNGIINANFGGGNIKLGGATTDAGLVVSGSKLYLGDWATLLKGLVVDLSSGSVGIGTTSPTVRLDISDNAPSGATRIRATNSSTSIFSSAALELFSHNGSSVSAGTSLFSTNNNFTYGTILSNQTNLYGVRSGGIRIATEIAPIIFSNGNLDIDFAIERMRITSGGNVLIGTTTDFGVKLAVSGNMHVTNSDARIRGGDLSGRLILSNSDTTAYVSINGGSNSSSNAIGIITNSQITFNTGASYNERMRITSDGYVGVGTGSTDVNNGDLIGVLAFRSNDASVNSSGAIGSIRSYATASFNTGNVSGDLRFYTQDTGTPNGSLLSGAERMRITSGGDVCIGTTSSTAGGVTMKTHISGTDFGLGISVNGSGSQQNIRFVNGTTAVGSVTTTGSTTTYNTVSDYRLKQDLKNINGLDLLSKIKVYDYEWKVDNSRSYGVLAHELQEVIPQAVNGEKDAEQMQGVDYSKLVPLLVAAIQELTARLEILENK